MKKLYKRMISSFAAAAISISSLGALSVSASESMILTEVVQPRTAAITMEENTVLETLASNPADSSAILTLAPQIVQMLNNMVVQGQYENFDIGDIQANQMIKVYVPEQDLFSMNTTDTDTILSALNNDIYMYVLYLPMGEKYAVVEISKGLPLSETGRATLSVEEQAKIQAQAGKWQVTGVGEIDQAPAYLDAAVYGLAQENGQGTARLVGGLEEFQQPVALIFSEEELETISLVNGAVLSGTWPELDALIADGTDPKDGLLDFAETSSIIHSPEETGVEIQAGVPADLIPTDSTISVLSSPIYDLGVERIQQDTNTWCWAACASMIAQYELNFLRCNQAFLVQHLKNQNKGYLAANEGATDAGVIFAIEYMLENKYTVQKYGVGSYSTIKSYIMSNNAPAAKIQWESGDNHLVVLGGTYDGYNSLLVIDPLPGCGRMWYEFTRLTSSNTFQSGSKGTMINLFKY